MDDDQIAQNLLEEYNLVDNESEHTEHADENNFNFLGIAFMAFIWIEGLRAGSKLVWIPEQECLYYRNGQSKHGTACTCVVSGCDARIFLRDDGTAEVNASMHKLHNTSLYPMYKERDLFKWMKDRCRSAPASATIRDIYDEAVAM